MSEALRAKVERHAAGAESLASALERDGIGLGERNGFVSLLRRMASDLRQQSARGITPASFESMYASGVPLSQQVLHTLRSAGLGHLAASSDVITSDDLTATFEAENVPTSDRISVRHALSACGRLTA